MNTPNVHAGRLERRVRRVGRDYVARDSWNLLFFSIRSNLRYSIHLFYLQHQVQDM